jgi:phosphoglycolate phosphatase-like HAD superfamily hydrolase
MKLQHICFDVSGTLWDDWHLARHSTLSILKKTGTTHAPCGTEITEEFLIRNPQASAVDSLRFCGLRGEGQDLHNLHIKAMREKHEEEQPALYEGVKELLLELKNRDIILSAVSAHPEELLYSGFKHHGIQDHFSGIMGDCYSSKTASIAELAYRFGAHTWYVGDSIKDMQNAHAACVPGVAVSYGYTPRDKLVETHPLMIIHSVQELKQKIFERL